MIRSSGKRVTILSMAAKERMPWMEGLEMITFMVEVVTIPLLAEKEMTCSLVIKAMILLTVGQGRILSMVEKETTP